jgi:mannose-1-phosphate guanylyltransferase
MAKAIDFRPIILAGGSGTRFWPRSRKARAKQVLALDGDRTMIQQTVERLRPLAEFADVWVITNDLMSDTISQQLEGVPTEQVICEPAPRNTAPAAALAAFLIEKQNPDAVLGVFPSDHVIADEPRFLKAIEKGIALAAEGDNMVVIGISPTRAETGYGYIETGGALNEGILRVRRFTEKPNQARAEEFVTAGNYHWNSGMFLWKASTLANAVREHLSESAPMLEEIAAAYGTPDFQQVFNDVYPHCENISVDYAILEPRSAKGEHKSNLFCLPAEFGWNDLGSWESLYEYQLNVRSRGDENSNVAECLDHLSFESKGNYVYSPGKFVALIGVEDLVVVETEDAILIADRRHSQEVGKVVKELASSGHKELI